MRVFLEKPYQFDFSAAPWAVVHDKSGDGSDGNNVWKGVDFRVGGYDCDYWIEVKSWSWSRVIGKDLRHELTLAFSSEVASDLFRLELVSKFLGTGSFLSWSGTSLPSKVHYLILLEPPDRSSLPLVGPLRDRLRDSFKNKNSHVWGSRIRVSLVTEAGFRTELPQFPLTRI